MQVLLQPAAPLLVGEEHSEPSDERHWHAWRAEEGGGLLGVQQLSQHVLGRREAFGVDGLAQRRLERPCKRDEVAHHLKRRLARQPTNGARMADGARRLSANDAGAHGASHSIVLLVEGPRRPRAGDRLCDLTAQAQDAPE